MHASRAGCWALVGDACGDPCQRRKLNTCSEHELDRSWGVVPRGRPQHHADAAKGGGGAELIHSRSRCAARFRHQRPRTPVRGGGREGGWRPGHAGQGCRGCGRRQTLAPSSSYGDRTTDRTPTTLSTGLLLDGEVTFVVVGSCRLPAPGSNVAPSCLVPPPIRSDYRRSAEVPPTCAPTSPVLSADGEDKSSA